MKIDIIWPYGQTIFMRKKKDSPTKGGKNVSICTYSLPFEQYSI